LEIHWIHVGNHECEKQNNRAFQNPGAQREQDWSQEFRYWGWVSQGVLKHVTRQRWQVQFNHADTSSSGTQRFLWMLEQSWEGIEISKHDEAGTQQQNKEEMDRNYE
jgi:hypothetical protein